MNAFESLIATLLQREGYWTSINFKVELTKAEKLKIGRHSSPRWELDVLAYHGSTNELLVVECKSFLDSKGVSYRNGNFGRPKLYKLFTEDVLRKVVFSRLKKQMVQKGYCAKSPSVTLCLAAGQIAKNTDREAMSAHFRKKKWLLFDEKWVLEKLSNSANAGYENDVAHTVAKLILRSSS